MEQPQAKPYLRDLRLDREVATADYQYGQS
jgi:hypothetical protein